MAKKTKLQYKTRYMPKASNVTIKSMYSGEVLGIKPPLGDKDLYKYLYNSRRKRSREWYLIVEK